MRIVPSIDPKVFTIECESLKEAAKIEAMKEFKYKGVTYEIKHIVPGFTETTYHSYFVLVK